MLKQENDNWFHLCRIALEWLHPIPGLDVEPWITEVVERAQRCNIDTLAFDIYHGGYAIFNNAVAAKDDHVGDTDLLALVDREVHKRGMRLVAMAMGHHCANYAKEQYDSMASWNVKGERGNPSNFGGICLNTGYGDYLIQEFRGLLPRYNIDGVYIEGLYGLECFCPYCCTEFQQMYGYPIPRDPEVWKTSRDYRRFREGYLTNFVRRMGNTIKQVSPKTVWMACPSFYDRYCDLATWGHYADAITLEQQWGYERSYLTNLFEVGLRMQLVRAESGRPPFGTQWLGWNVDMDYAHCTSEHYRLTFAQTLMYNATPQIHLQTIFDLDQSELPTVREMYDLVEHVRPTLVDADLVSYVALVEEYVNSDVSDNFRGFYQALIEHHIPFRVISSRDLKPEVLKRFKAVALPNITRLTDEQIEAVKGFNALGGGVVFTYRTGWVRPDGSVRGDMPFAEIAGVEGPFGIVSSPPAPDLDYRYPLMNYYKVTQDHTIGTGTCGRLQSFEGSFVEVEITTGEAVAMAMDLDYSKMHRRHPVIGMYPKDPIFPLIVVNEQAGRGRVAYFAGDFDRASFQAGLPGTLDTLAEAAVWAAGGVPPAEFECSPTVETAVHYSPGSNAYTIILLNKTTNQNDKVIRHVEPVRDTRITLRDLPGAVEDVRSLIGSELDWDASDGECHITLPILHEYDALVVQFGK